MHDDQKIVKNACLCVFLLQLMNGTVDDADDDVYSPSHVPFAFPGFLGSLVWTQYSVCHTKKIS